MNMKNRKILFWLLGALIIFTVIGFSFPVAYAAEGVKFPTTGLSEKKIEEILTNLLNWLLGVVGVIALIGFVVSGIIYLISAGNDEMITKAKKYMLYCLVGITVALASYVVVKAIDTILNAGGSAPPSSSPFTSV